MFSVLSLILYNFGDLIRMEMYTAVIVVLCCVIDILAARVIDIARKRKIDSCLLGLNECFMGEGELICV